MLNPADDPSSCSPTCMFDEFGSVGETVRADFAQVNLGSVLFAVADTIVEPAPELRTPKIAERAMISIPPVQGHRPHPPAAERSLRDALTELTGQLPAGHRGDLLVGLARRGTGDRRPRGVNHGRWPRSWRRTRRSTRGPASISSRPREPAARRPRAVVRPRHRSGPRTPRRRPARRPPGPRSTRPGPRRIARRES